MPTDAEMLAFIDEGIQVVPYNAALGLRAVGVGEGNVTIVLPYRENLVGNPDTGVLHGGAITALLDATCGVAVFVKRKSPSRIATLDLRIDYLKPATPKKDVNAHAECFKVTRQVAFVRASAYHEDPKDPIAMAAGTFIIFEEGESPMALAGRKK